MLLEGLLAGLLEGLLEDGIILGLRYSVCRGLRPVPSPTVCACASAERGAGIAIDIGEETLGLSIGRRTVC